MICPRCSVAEISDATGACELCGYVPNGHVAVAAPHPDATDELARAQLAHQFRIDVLLGQGSNSVVYLARESDSNRHIVLKVLPRVTGQPGADARFRDAIAAVIALDHPHLVPVLRHGETDSLLWYSMEHRRARPLHDVLRTGGRLDYRASMRLVTQIAGALDYLHRRGATHGRLKPENVLVDAEHWVYVCDAIVARAIHGTPPGSAERTPSPYTAPEDLLGGLVGPASDQFALAALIHEVLAGAPRTLAVAGAPVPPALADLRPDLPAHVQHAVTRALSPRPNDRYPTVLDFATALESGGSLLVDARPSGRASDLILTIPGWEPIKQERPRWLIPAGIAAGVAVITVTALVLLNRPAPRQQQVYRQPPPASTLPAPADSAAIPAPAPAPAPVAASGPAPVIPIAPPASYGERARRQEGVERPRFVDLRSRERSTGNPPRTPAAPRTQPNQRAAAPRPAPAPAPASTPPATPPAAPAGDPGRLFVNASPWGQLYLDGQLIGNTPKANIPVSPGAHTIRVARDGFEPVERTIRVGAGETVRLTDLVLTPRP